MKIFLNFIIICMICFTAPLIQAEEETAGKEFKPYVTLSGIDSAVQERSYFRIMSQNDWIMVWKKYKGFPESAKLDLLREFHDLPIVDFEKCMVIAIFKGAGANSAGIFAVKVVEGNDHILLRFDDKSYQTIGQANKVNVYGFFILPVSTKNVILEENVQNLIGQPPVWKERAKFSTLVQEGK